MSEEKGTYDIILQELADGELTEIEQRVFGALKRYPQGVTRPQLVAICFGRMTNNLVVNNSTYDRKVRLAIASLRERMVPIMSSSGASGYRLDTSVEARRAMVADLMSRRDKITQMINRMAKAYEMPDLFPTQEIARQERLI